MVEIPAVFKERAALSCKQLENVRKTISDLGELKCFEDLTVFGAGSYARHEASIYSDIDLFFLCRKSRDEQIDPRTKEFRLFGKMIEIIETLKFPKFSNDCQYLNVLSTRDILQHLGSPTDDHENYFTARMLLLLESKCLYGDEIYNKVISEIVHSYFADYPNHSHEFQPIFLLNDICRYWKTLLLNYENKRNGAEETDAQKVKQRVRNFKLKFSRMTTCFATVSAIGSYKTPVTEGQVVRLVHLTPRERLQDIIRHVPDAKNEVQNILDEYAWFLEMTGLPTEELQSKFHDKTGRTKMFQKANEYGNLMFNLLLKLDKNSNGKGDLLRYLVI